MIHEHVHPGRPTATFREMARTMRSIGTASGLEIAVRESE
jgi:hypothetical protein